MTRALAVLFALHALGCATEAELAVTVRTDLIAGYEFVRVEVAPEDLPVTQVGASLDQHWFRGVSVASYRSVASRSIAVRVRLFDPDGAVLLERPYLVEVRGATSLLATLTRDCLGVICPEDGGSEDAISCVGGECASAVCIDGTGGEGCPMRCADNLDCPSSSECAPGQCVDGLCMAGDDEESVCEAPTVCFGPLGCYPSSCGDALVGEGESDRDCGGPCPGCALGRNCGSNRDCESGFCAAGICGRVRTCNNGTRDSDEEGVDCGGSCGRPCLEFDCALQTDIEVEECEFLRDFYNSTRGTDWTENVDWFSDQAPCGWSGVTCRDGHVDELEVIEPALAGVLPRGWDRVGQLERIIIQPTRGFVQTRSALGGTLPAEIGTLSRLRELRIAGHLISGSIPEEFGALTEIRVLDLRFNRLGGPWPESLGNLVHIVLLYLEENDLEGPIPETIGAWTEIVLIFAQGNRLTGPLPRAIGNLRNLDHLQLNANRIDGPLPPELGDCDSLEALILYSNRLEGAIPDELWSMPAIEEIELANNRLSGSLTAAIGNASSLNSLTLDQNQLTGNIPPELATLRALRSLSIEDNRLQGEIPGELGSTPSLVSLSLGDNQLSGPIPSALFSGAPLEGLRLDNNQLSGAVPPEIRALDRLRSVRLCPQTGALFADEETGAFVDALSEGTWEPGGC